MVLTDMAAVYPVDGEVLSRTRAFLLSRRDGRGGFAWSARPADGAAGAPEELLEAYITWALGQAKISGIEAEIARVRGRALGSEDSYLLALGANVLLGADDGAAAAVLDKLARKQEPDGAVRGAATSISRSTGTSLLVETTSLAILAWIKAGQAEPAAQAMAWLLRQRRGGRFGSAPATILALKAIVAHDEREPRARYAGAARIRVDGRPAGEVSIAAHHDGPIELPSFAFALTAGEHQVEIELSCGAPMPYALSVRCHTPLPPAAGAGGIALTTELGREAIAEGELVELIVAIVNKTDQALSGVVAAVGLPGALEPRIERLEELRAGGQIDAFERVGRELWLYRRSMAPGERSSLSLALLGAVPGTYVGPASRAYLQAADEEKAWAPPLQIRVIAAR
jgi:hypothetical protein